MTRQKKIKPAGGTFYENLSSAGIGINIRRLVIDNGADLNCITFTPANINGAPPIVFVAGFASVVENFTDLLSALSETFIIHYVETRDKHSSILPENTTFTVRDVASDISAAIDQLDIESGKYILWGYSLGATSSVEAFSSVLRKKPKLLILAEPNGKFRIPAIGTFIARYLSWGYRIIKPFLKLYIKIFHVNTKEDYEMYTITVRAMDNADPRKMAQTLLEMVKYEIWDALDKIDVPVIVIGASKDIFHTYGDALEISSRIRNSKYYDLETNKRTHSREVSDLLVRELSEMNA